jgi:hypothetical protein
MVSLVTSILKRNFEQNITVFYGPVKSLEVEFLVNSHTILISSLKVVQSLSEEFSPAAMFCVIYSELNRTRQN